MAKEAGNQMPEFDFGMVSHAWARRWATRMTRATALGVTLDKLAAREKVRGELTEREGKTLQKCMQELESIGDEQEQLVSAVLVSVPGDWLVRDAPDDLDWSQPESLGWLQERRYGDLVTALNEQRQADLKNSAGSTARR